MYLRSVAPVSHTIHKPPYTASLYIMVCRARYKATVNVHVEFTGKHRIAGSEKKKKKREDSQNQHCSHSVKAAAWTLHTASGIARRVTVHI